MKKIDNFEWKRLFCLILTVASVTVLIVLELFSPKYSDDAVLDPLIKMIISRAIGGAVFIVVSWYLGFKFFDPFARPFFKSLVFILPCIAVAVNNFPILSTVWGDAYLVAPKSYIAVYAIECLMIGIFEEFAFRGVVFLSVLEKRRETTLGIFLSIVLTSAIFGAVHLLNLFQGAGLGSVIMQIGYSFLIGGMCSVVLIKTRNIWFCVMIHALYDFCGYFMPTLGGGTWWDTPTVVFTVILALAVTVYMVLALVKIDPKTTDELYSKKSNESNEFREE